MEAPSITKLQNVYLHLHAIDQVLTGGTTKVHNETEKAQKVILLAQPLFNLDRDLASGEESLPNCTMSTIDGNLIETNKIPKAMWDVLQRDFKCHIDALIAAQYALEDIDEPDTTEILDNQIPLETELRLTRDSAQSMLELVRMLLNNNNDSGVKESLMEDTQLDGAPLDSYENMSTKMLVWGLAASMGLERSSAHERMEYVDLITHFLELQDQSAHMTRLQYNSKTKGVRHIWSYVSVHTTDQYGQPNGLETLRCNRGEKFPSGMIKTSAKPVGPRREGWGDVGSNVRRLRTKASINEPSKTNSIAKPTALLQDQDYRGAGDLDGAALQKHPSLLSDIPQGSYRSLPDYFVEFVYSYIEKQLENKKSQKRGNCGRANIDTAVGILALIDTAWGRYKELAKKLDSTCTNDNNYIQDQKQRNIVLQALENEMCTLDATARKKTKQAWYRTQVAILKKLHTHAQPKFYRGIYDAYSELSYNLTRDHTHLIRENGRLGDRNRTPSGMITWLNEKVIKYMTITDPKAYCTSKIMAGRSMYYKDVNNNIHLDHLALDAIIDLGTLINPEYISTLGALAMERGNDDVAEHCINRMDDYQVGKLLATLDINENYDDDDRITRIRQVWAKRHTLNASSKNGEGELSRTHSRGMGIQQLTKPIKTSHTLGGVLSRLGAMDCKIVCKSLKEQLPGMIKSAEVVGEVLKGLDTDKCDAFCEAMKEELPDIIRDAKGVGKVLKDLDADQCRAFCDAMKEELPDIIKDAKGVGKVLKDLDANQCRAFCDAMKEARPEIIKNAEGVGEVLKDLDEEQCGAFCDAMKDKLPSIIKDAESLRKSAKICENVPARIALLNSIPDQELAGWFTNRVILQKTSVAFECGNVNYLYTRLRSIRQGQMSNGKPVLYPSSYGLWLTGREKLINKHTRTESPAKNCLPLATLWRGTPHISGPANQ